MEANQTLDALETLMAMENLPKLSNFFVAGWYSGIGEFCKVLDSLHRLESHKTYSQTKNRPYRPVIFCCPERDSNSHTTAGTWT